MCMIHVMCIMHMAWPPLEGRPMRPTQDRELGTGPIVGVLAFAGIVVALMQTLVVPLIPELPALLHTSASNASWAITATLLAGAVATPVLGRLGDMYGKRRVLLISLGLLVIGSVVCGLSNTLGPMVVGRALQGCAVGVIPLGISIMRDELPAEKLGSAMALMSSSLGVGGALGLPAAAALAEHANWHLLFWLSAVLGVVVAGLILLVVAESPLRGGGRFDLLGAAGLSVGLISLLLGISKGAEWGWWELRVTGPLVDLRTTARRQVLVTNLASIVVGFSFYAMSLVLPQLLQLPSSTGYGLGQSMLVAGLCLGPSGLTMMAVSPLSARLTAARGPKVSLMIGSLIIAVGYGLAIAFMTAVWELAIVACVIGVGIGLGYAAMPALIMAAVPRAETASANGVNTLMRSIGTSTSSAVVGVVLANLTTHFGSSDLPSQTGFRVALAIGGIAALVGVLVASFIPARRAVSPDGRVALVSPALLPSET
jgi:MFS family permease